ncbi:MAG: SusC/RagA family TonB-linked outer membrane protein [Gemmatimonadetes bacterium]|nr:SusC/RagA family TonB-linked outer membrane protein [Gemmatimonadota bacterium]
MQYLKCDTPLLPDCCRARHGRWLTATMALFLAVLSGSPALAQQGSIGGVVVAEQSMRPLAGAQVLVEGTDRGTLTDASGRFLITGVTGTEVTLRVVMLGYRATTRAARVGDTSVRIGLAEAAVELDEVLVTGVAGGTQRRAIGNVVSQIRAADVVEIAPVQNLQSLINARAPGVVVTPGTGMVGSGSRIRVRGASSLSLSNEPLIYVDGVRVDNAQATGPVVQGFGSSVISRLNDFNPRDIESIEIIKGPAAATLYGTEASNGVIQIITKKGAAGAPAMNLTVRQGANWFANADGRVPTNYWRNPATNQVESINLAVTERALGTPIWRTGHVQSYNLNMSGGAENVRYYVAGDWDNEEGAERDNMLRRASARANLTINPYESLDVTGSFGYIRGRTDLSCEAGCGGTTWASYFSTPQFAQAGDVRRGARTLTPEAYWGIWDRFQDLSRTTASIQVNHRPLRWFTQRLNFGTDETREDNQTIAERSAQYQEWFPTGTGGKTVGRRDATFLTVDYSGSVNLPLTEGLNSISSFGAQMYRRQTRFVSASGSDFALPGLRVINAAAQTSAGETFVQNTTLGIFGQQQFGWRDRLFVTAGLRADDNSAFGEDFTIVTYPKVSATWVVSEEPFFTLPFVNTFRLRSAYGHTGQQPGAFDALRTFVAVAGPGDISTVSPGSVGNPELGPERASELEVGFDAGFLQDRLGVEFTFYNQRTRDAILLESVAPSTGFAGSRFINVGELANRGFEVMLRGQPYAGRNLSMDMTFSYSGSRSEVVDLGGEQSIVESGFGIEHRLGMPVGGWYHRRIVSAEFNEAGEVNRASMLCDNGQGGTTACYSGNTVVAPRVFLGQALPQNEGAVTTTFTLFERLRLYGMVDFKRGYQKWDHVTRVRCSLFRNCRENVAPLEFVSTDPTSANNVQLAAYQTGDAFGAEYINDSGFAKLREVSASYSLPANIAGRFGSSRASISVAARNLYTWTNWTGMEPEAMFLSGARGGFMQLEQNHLPQLTQFVTTVNLSF